MTGKWRETLDGFTREFERLGTRALPNGARLVGLVPHIAPEAYLLSLYAPLSPAEIGALEQELGEVLPEPLRRLYSVHNGMKLFSDSLTIDGHRTSDARTGDAARQPYSIVTPNREERPRDARAGDLFFGGYGYDGSLLFFRMGSEEVYVSRAGSATPYGSWPSLDDMLDSELRRLRGHFDDQGRKDDSRADTTPSFG